MASTKNILAVLGGTSSQNESEKTLPVEKEALDQPRLTLASQNSLANVLENCLSATKKSDCTPQS
jgi:hypothetical protein